MPTIQHCQYLSSETTPADCVLRLAALSDFLLFKPLFAAEAFNLNGNALSLLAGRHIPRLNPSSVHMASREASY